MQLWDMSVDDHSVHNIYIYIHYDSSHDADKI